MSLLETASVMMEKLIVLLNTLSENVEQLFYDLKLDWMSILILVCLALFAIQIFRVLAS